MHWRCPSLAWHALILAGLIASVGLGLPVDERMVVRPAAGQRLAGQSSAAADAGPRASQEIEKTAQGRRARYGFENFTGDKLEVSFAIADREFAAYNDAFGYTQQDLDGLKAWKAVARQKALKAAVGRGDSQAQLDASVAVVEEEYKRKLTDYLAARGFALEPGNAVVVDMPRLVRNNAPLIKPLAENFARIAAQRRYGSLELVESILSFVQTAMFYKEPDPVVDGKHNGGLLPPLTSVSLGWGDCDTKTGVIASILANWSETKMVGVSVPGHFLMGVLQVPEKGDTFLEYQGLRYVLLEPAGPAWLPPGRVGEETSVLLAGRDGYKAEPFF